MKSKKLILTILLIEVVFFSLLLVNTSNITPPPHFNDLDSGSLLDSLYAVALTSLVLFLASGLGKILIRPFVLYDWTFIERTVISLPLGLAAIGYGEFILGLLGWIQPKHQIAWLIIIALISFKDGVSLLHESIAVIKRFGYTWQCFSIIKKTFFVAGVMALFLGLIMTMTPPFDYDGLMYHLQGPRLFLEAGKIIPIPENWFTYYPSTWEMIYMLGMGLGSDIFARLIHFSTLLLLIFSTFVFGKRFLPEPGGWIAAGIMVGMPMMLLWGSFAYTDMAWALFQFTAVALLLVWVANKNKEVLILSGVMQGLALGSKYLAFYGAGILGLVIIWKSLLNNQHENRWTDLLENAAFFGISALFIALPWYLKNYLWTGNPVFPLYLPQNVINPVELKLVMEYLSSFGTGENWFDYLLLPISIYIKYPRFVTFAGNLDFPHPIFLIVFAYPWARRMTQKRRLILDTMMIIIVLQFIAWAIGSQQNRFLTPLYPSLSIISSAVILNSLRKIKTLRIDRIIGGGIVGGMIIVSLISMGRYFVLLRPHYVIFGIESKSDFLHNALIDYSANEFINNQLTDNAKVLMPWNGKGYYCNDKCYPDVGQSKWAALIQNINEPEEVSIWLKHHGVTHILLSEDDILFMTQHDPYNIHRQALEFTQNEYLLNCAKLIYYDDWTSLYQLRLENVYCN